MKRFFTILLSLIILSSCGSLNQEENPADFESSYSRGDALRIVAGSENKELEPIIDQYAKENKQNIHIDYMGSLDIMRLIEDEDMAYDAVWPASSIWLNLGDKGHILKYSETISQSPVVFAIKKPLASELGFVDKDVTTSQIIDAIKNDKLKFTMTSASQSNSGASAYLGFLGALAKDPDGLSKEDLADPSLKEDITSLLAGVERSSGSSNWLVDLFLEGDYDAMVNYEQLAIATNQKLIEAGRPPLYLVYPSDGLAISDSPLAYVDKGDSEKEEAFLGLKEYLLSDQAQSQIEATGKRSAYGTVREENRHIYESRWGIDLDRTLNPVRFPKADVIMEALNLYQTDFKKPAFTIYVLDYSGSMNRNDGYTQLDKAMNEVLVPENARANLLLGTQNDITYVLPFSDKVMTRLEARGNGQEMADMYKTLNDKYYPTSSTFLYEAIIEAVDIFKENKEELDKYSPAIVVLTDGRPTGYKEFAHLSQAYRDLDYDLPIFSILFGDARKEDLDQIATMSKGRVFDGRTDMIKSFQEVKGYN